MLQSSSRAVFCVAAAVLAIAAVVVIAMAQTESELYFAADATGSGIDESKNQWYSSQLRAMDEPVLRATKARRAYRFTWLRTFDHPLAFRAEWLDGRPTLIATELDGAGGYEPGKVLRKKTVSLTPEQFRELEQFIEQQDFWSLPTNIDTLGMDGSQWIVEGASSTYHVVDRWSPEDGPVRAIGEKFIALGGWAVPEKELY